MRFRCPHCGETADTQRGALVDRIVGPDAEARAVSRQLREVADRIRSELTLPVDEPDEETLSWLASLGIGLQQPLFGSDHGRNK